MMVISTRDLSRLPDIQGLRLLSQSLALLDAVLCPEWEYRYYSFNAKWGADAALASMRNGEGDNYLCLFNQSGAILKGFAHESTMSPWRSDPPRLWPGILDSVPPCFSDVLAEPAFAIEETTFCIWRTHDDASWQRGDIQFPQVHDADGSAELLQLLDGNPRSYQRWAEDYFQRPVSLEAITHIYLRGPITPEVIRTLNPDLSMQGLAPDMLEIGYTPSAR